MSSEIASNDEILPLLIEPDITIVDKELFQQPDDISTILDTATENPSTLNLSIKSVTNSTTNPKTTCKHSVYDVLVGGRRKVLKTI